MISKKVFAADGMNIRFLSDFIIRSEQFTRVYNYIYDVGGVDGTVDAGSGLYVRVTDFPKSDDLVTIDKWDLVDNSISFYSAPFATSRVYIEVATTAEEFGDTLVQPSVERAESAADAAELSEAAAALSEAAAALSETNAAASEAAALASKNAAALSESNASASETAAGLSEAAAALSEAAAALSETNAAASEAAALASEGAAAASAAAALASETAAALSETNAAASAALAATFEPALYVAKSEVVSAIGNVNNPLLDLPLNNSLAMKQGVGSVTFARSTTATYIDRYGVLQYAAIDEPRFEKDGLLIEGASTNTLFPSDMSTHTDLGYTRTTSVGVDGVADSAIRLTEDTSTSQRRLRDTTENAVGGTIGDVFTMSVFVKPNGDRNNITLLLGTDVSDSTLCEFRLSDLTIGASSSSDGTVSGEKIEDIGNGWYRLSMTLTLTVTVTTMGGWVFFSNVYGDGNATYLGDGASYIDVFGMQIEELPFASSYIPTTTTAVTRVLDTNGACSFSYYGNVPGFNSDYTICADISIADFTDTFQGILYFPTPSGGHILRHSSGVLRFITEGGSQVNSTYSTENEKIRIVITRVGTTISMYVDGVFADTSSVVDNEEEVNADIQIGSSTANITIGNIRFYGLGLTPTEAAIA